MKKKVFILLSALCAAAALFTACKKEEQGAAVDAAHNTRNSVDWAGTYTGTIPAASGPGIEVTLTLNNDESYSISYIYIDHEEDGPFEAKGKFSWQADGGTIVLKLPSDMREGSFPTYYKVGEGKIFQLDLEGNIITGELASLYILTKN